MIGIIVGSGLNRIAELANRDGWRGQPYGEPSAALTAADCMGGWWYSCPPRRRPTQSRHQDQLPSQYLGLHAQGVRGVIA